MAKKDKAKKKVVRPAKVMVTPEEKSKMKADIKALKAEKNAAIEEGDKKKLKAARYKIKKQKLKLKRVGVLQPKAEEAPKQEAAG